MPTKVEKLLGAHIAKLRKERGLTQFELASMVGVAFETISRLERGVSMPSVKTLEAISKALTVRLKDLFDFEGEEKRIDFTKDEKELRKLLAYLKTRNKSDIKLAHRILKSLFDEIDKNYRR